jgi:hypothetical protein
MSSIQQTNQMETCSKCETKIDIEKDGGWDYCVCLDAHFCSSCSPTNTCSCEGDGSCDCANCDEEAWAEAELYRHYECCECEANIEAVGTLYDDVLCAECERKGDDEKTNEDDNASPKGLKKEVCNTSISSMDEQIISVKVVDLRDAQQKERDLLAEYIALWKDWKELDEFIKPNPEYPKCVICKEHFSGTRFGNNPQPIRKKGKCCDRCNHDKVIPARFSGSIIGGNPFGSLDEQILCRKIQTFTPTQGRTDGKQDYPLIWEAFKADQLEDEIADVIKQFYKKTMRRGVFPLIKDDGGITFTDMYSAIKDGKAFIRGIKK